MQSNFLLKMPMPHIEIWQSKQRWHTAPAGERDRVIKTLAHIVRDHGEEIETSGPYLHCVGKSCWLIWDVRDESATVLRPRFESLLAAYFEPLMTGAAGQLTAKDYYERMSRQSPLE